MTDRNIPTMLAPNYWLPPPHKHAAIIHETMNLFTRNWSLNIVHVEC